MSHSIKKKIHTTNMVNKDDPINITSITTQKNTLNKFQICLSKLNDNSTKELAFNQIKEIISMNISDPSSLRAYLSALGSYNSKTSNISQGAKELQCLLYGYISSVYKDNLYDPIDNPPNLIKTINRMLSQLRNSYLNEQSYIVHKACSHSYSELLIQSMPKDDMRSIIVIFFEPLLGLIATGSSRHIQDGAAICLCDLIECIGKGECGDEVMTVLDMISDKIITQLLKGPISNNNFVIDALYQLMTYSNFDNFTSFLKELYDRLTLIIKSKDISYQGKISVLNVLGLIAERVSSMSDMAIGYYQPEIKEVIKEATKDRIHKVQVVAREVLSKWNALEMVYKENDKGKFIPNEDVFSFRDRSKEKKIKVKENDPFKYAYIDERDYKVRNVMKTAKERISKSKERYNNLFNSNNSVQVNIEENEKNSNNIETISPAKKLVKKENNTTVILKLTLSNLITTTLENAQNTFMDNISSRLTILENKINRVSQKVSSLPIHEHESTSNNTSFMVINNQRINEQKQRSNTDTKTSEVWKRALDLLDKEKYDIAYNEILNEEDDIYLLRLVCLTGPILNSLNESTAQKVLNRINMIHRGNQIQNVLLDLVNQSIKNKKVFWKMNYKEQNDILDSLYQIGKINSPLSDRAKILYDNIIADANNNIYKE